MNKEVVILSGSTIIGAIIGVTVQEIKAHRQRRTINEYGNQINELHDRVDALEESRKAMNFLIDVCENPDKYKLEES